VRPLDWTSTADPLVARLPDPGRVRAAAFRQLWRILPRNRRRIDANLHAIGSHPLHARPRRLGRACVARESVGTVAVPVASIGRRRIVVGVVERVARSRGIVNRRGLTYVPVPMIAGPLIRGTSGERLPSRVGLPPTDTGTGRAASNSQSNPAPWRSRATKAASALCRG
jgi:hypothetical protein